MQRVNILLEKIKELNKSEISMLDVDLMLDYIRVLYADVLEYRNKLAFQVQIGLIPSVAPTRQPVPEITEPLVQEQAKEKKEEVTFMPPVVEQNGPREIPVPQQKDLKSLIGINDKYLYISEVFFNNKETYEQAIQALNQLEDLEQAKSWLRQNVEGAYRWQLENEALQSFYALLGSFYEKK
jgi:hypothetical protein